MDKEITKFGETEIEKRKFYHRKNIILSENIYIQNIPIPRMVFPVFFPNISLLTKMIMMMMMMMMMMIVKLNSYALYFQTKALI